MINWPFGKKARQRKAEARLIYGSAETGLSEEEREIRADFIERYMSVTGQSRESVTKLADSWEIIKCNSSYGSGPAEVSYIPCPVWDSEWMWRPIFKTRDEAEAYVQSRNASVVSDV